MKDFIFIATRLGPQLKGLTTKHEFSINKYSAALKVKLNLKPHSVKASLTIIWSAGGS